MFALAWREGRAGVRRIGVYVAAVALGVAAVVSLNSLRRSLADSLDAEARTLLGADLRLESSRPFPAPVEAVLDSLAARGYRLARVTRFASMVLAEPSRRSRLLQVRALDGSYPFYGRVSTDPPGEWARFRGGRRALVDPAVLIQLDARVGDTLTIGGARFAIHGSVMNLPGELSFQAAIGPRVYIPREYLSETGLVRVGSLVRHEAYLELPDEAARDALVDAHRALFATNLVDTDTPEEQAERMTEALGAFTRFLGLVGLTALLLGATGVASAVHAFVRQRRTTVAVLRCLGARRRTVFLAYLVQAGALGLSGAMAGALLGVLVLAALPRLLAGALPVPVNVAPDPVAILAGFGTGIWIAGLFAALPLLEIRNVTPLEALRRHVQGPSGRARDPLRMLAGAALAASVLLLAVWQAPTRQAGLLFTAGIIVLGGVFTLTARALAGVARRCFPDRAAYVVRQGVANLFRPSNQTVAVTLALGFAVFLVATLEVVRENLLARFAVEPGAERPNLLLFDLQRDQIDGVAALFRDRGFALRDLTPIVPARISGVNGRPVGELLADTSHSAPRGWPLRREYRNTYRDTLVRTEEVVAGRWWRPHDVRGASTQPQSVTRISVEEELAGDLGVGPGDRITWDLQGAVLESEVANLRRVDWARFEPNFFVVFESGVLEDAPQSFVALARIPDASVRARLQGEIVRRYANVAVLDLAVVQETLDQILGKVAIYVRFMALLSMAAGLLVLAGAVGASQYQRTRESALLRTLGASAAQIRGILFTEYAALGTLAGLTGILCAGVAGWLLVRFFFELSFELPVAALVLPGAGVVVLTTLVGVLGSRRVLHRAPLSVLRETAD